MPGSLAYVIANGKELPVTHAIMIAPYSGVWCCDLVIASDAPCSGSVRLVIGDLECVGVCDVTQNGVFGLTRRLRIVGGAAGWSKILPPRGYHNDANVSASSVAQDAATACGETLGVFAPARARLGADYVRRTAPASQALVDAAGGAVWWVDFAGITHVGARAESVASPTSFRLLGYNPKTAVAEIAVDSVKALGVGSQLSDPSLDAAITIREYSIELKSDTLRIRAWCGDPPVRGRIADALYAIANKANPGLFGLYKFRVLRMSVDRVELQAVRSIDGLPDVLHVSMWSGPGIHAKLSPGSECLVQFVNGDRAEPVITSFGPKGSPNSNPTELQLAGDAARVALQGGLVQCGGPGTQILFTPLPGNSAPFVLPGVPYLVSFGSLPSPAPQAPLYGAISTGSTKVKAAT